MPTKKPRKVDNVKAAADELVDAFVNGEPTHTLQFAERLAAERARAHQTHGLFKVWSLNNQIYLEGQRRARRAEVRGLFAGAAQWEKMGREVLPETENRPAPEPYMIYGSPFRRVDERVDDQNNVVEEVRYVGTHRIRVYDWSQTRSMSEDYVEPDWETPLGYGDYATLVKLVGTSPLPVEFTDLSMTTAHGVLATDRVVIDSSANVGNQIVELARRLGELALREVPANGRSGRDDEVTYTSREVAEQEAAIVGWLVAKQLGIDESVGNEVTAQAAEHLHRWTKRNADGEQITLEGPKSRRRLIKERLGRAMLAADIIFTAYCAEENDDTVVADPARELVAEPA